MRRKFPLSLSELRGLCLENLVSWTNGAVAPASCLRLWNARPARPANQEAVHQSCSIKQLLGAHLVLSMHGNIALLNVLYKISQVAASLLGVKCLEAIPRIQRAARRDFLYHKISLPGSLCLQTTASILLHKRRPCGCPAPRKLMKTPCAEACALSYRNQKNVLNSQHPFNCRV